MKAWLKSLARKYLSVETRRKITRYTIWPPKYLIRFGSLRRLQPISEDWGMERGQPVDRYYIEQFLAQHANDVRGHVLEIGGNGYTMKYGGDKVTKSDVLHIAEANPQVTIIGDLTDADHIPANTFDCLILTQTLQVIFDVPAAIKTVYRILKPGGIALVTTAGISKISRYDMDRWGYYWGFTTASLTRLFTAAFPEKSIQITAHGNVLSTIAFLHGIAAEELKAKELRYDDKDYELLITIRAQKPQGQAGT